jgi:hypothetical protein
MHNVTTVASSDRNKRMLSYSLSMLIRLMCIGLCFIIEGWWLLLPIAGAILLPYIAVVNANTKSITNEHIESPHKPLVKV